MVTGHFSNFDLLDPKAIDFQLTLSDWTNQITGGDEPNTVAILIAVVMLATIGMVGSAARALGEEIGWRGFMIWEMRKIMPFWTVGIFSGLIWAVWHWPAILFTDYNAGEGSFILHASHNLFIQKIYTPLTIRGDGTHFYIDEFGIVMPTIGCVLAFYFYRRARKEGIA